MAGLRADAALAWRAVGAGLLLLFAWAYVSTDAVIISPFGCLCVACPNGYPPDSSPWLSVVRGPGLHAGNVYQYWLTHAYAYGINAQAELFETQVWKMPPDVHPVDGLTLTYYDNAPNDQELRVLLLNSSNCLFEFYVTSVLPHNPPKYRLTTTYCFDGDLPLWQKMVPDNDNLDMTNTKFIYLVSLTHVAVVSSDSIQPVSIIKLPPGGEIPVTTVVGAVYRRNSASGAQDQLFIIRGSSGTNGTASQASELIYYHVDAANSYPGPRLIFDHVTYLQGASDTLFLNGNTMELFWTQVEESRDQSAGRGQGLLYGYGLDGPHRFRQGSLNFSSGASWGAHSFSFKTAVEAMMITAKNYSAPLGYTIYAMSLDSALPLQLTDSLQVHDSTLPSLGHGTIFRRDPLYQGIDFSVVMGSHDVNGNACLTDFYHCPYDAYDPRCSIDSP